MKKKFTLLLWVLLVFYFSDSSFGEETIRLATEEYPPYTSEKLKYYGLATRIVTDAFALEGVKTKYGFFPGARAFLEAKNGNWDGSHIWAKKKDRLKFFYYTDPLLSEYDSVFFHKKSFDFSRFSYDPKSENFDSLKGLRIGAFIGYDYGEAFEKAEKSKIITVHRVSKYRQNFMMLLLDRIDLFVANKIVGYFYLSQEFEPKQTELITDSLRRNKASSYYLILSKKVEKNKYYLKVFNRGLKRLKESAKYDQYFEDLRKGEYLKKE